MRENYRKTEIGVNRGEVSEAFSRKQAARRMHFSEVWGPAGAQPVSAGPPGARGSVFPGPDKAAPSHLPS